MFPFRPFVSDSRLLRAGQEQSGFLTAPRGPPPGVTPRAERQCRNALPHPSSIPVKFS